METGEPMTTDGQRHPAQGTELAVILPLDDFRGDVLAHLRSWTHGQVLPRGRYQVIVGASGERPDLERRVAELLAPQDSLVVAPRASLIELYDTAARSARAPLLVFTEAHCHAEPGCLAAVAEAFTADHGLDAATLKHLQSASTAVGELSKRWFTHVFDAWEREGWTRLLVAGFAIRAESYASVGGLNPRLELFADDFMSACLQDEGARIAHLEEAVLTHMHQEGMAESLALSRSYVRGECVVRREHEAEFCERYFGPAGLWGRRLAYRPRIAAPMFAAIISAARSSPRDAAWLSRELVARLPARVAGSRPRWAWERMTAGWHQVVAGTAAVPAEARWRSYVAAQERNVRATQLRESGQENGLPTTPGGTGSVLGAESLDGMLVSAHGLEGEPGQRFRWTEPVALLRLALPEEGAVLRVQTGGLRGAPISYLQGIYAGRLRLPPEFISGDDETLEARLPPSFARASAGRGIVLVCHPLVPSRAGSSDRRRLGMPIVELGLSAG